jgi:chromosome segregation ATPase
MGSGPPRFHGPPGMASAEDCAAIAWNMRVLNTTQAEHQLNAQIKLNSKIADDVVAMRAECDTLRAELADTNLALSERLKTLADMRARAERAEAKIAELLKGLEASRDRSNAAWRAQQNAERELAEARALLHRLKRAGEMSAAMMRDDRRTGAWEGSERVARAFARMSELAAKALAKEQPR